MEILRKSSSWLQNIATVAMVIVTGLQTAMNLWTMGMRVWWGLYTSHRLMIGFLVFIGLSAAWGCVTGFNRTDRPRTAILFAVVWTILTILVGFGPIF